MSEPTTAMRLDAGELRIMLAALLGLAETVSEEGGDTGPVYELAARARRAAARLDARRPAEERERDQAARAEVLALIEKRPGG